MASMKRRLGTTNYVAKRAKTTTKPSGLTPTQVAAVRRIAATVDERRKEKKIFWSFGSLVTPSAPMSANLRPQAVYLANPFYPITQGTADYNRIGDSIFPKSVFFRWDIEQYSGLYNSSLDIRIICFWSDAQLSCYSAGVPTLQASTSILPTEYIFYGGADGLQSTKAFTNSNNIRVVYDKNYTLNQNSSTLATNLATNRKKIKFRIPMPNRKLQYYDATSTVGGGGFMKDKNFYCAIMVDSPYADANDPLAYVECRFITTYTDA